MKFRPSNALRLSLTLPLLGLAVTLPGLGSSPDQEPPSVEATPSPTPPGPSPSPSGNGETTHSSSSPAQTAGQGSSQQKSPPPGNSEQGPPAANQAGPNEDYAPGRALVGATIGQREEAESGIRGAGGRIRSFHSPGNLYIVETPSRAPDWARSVRAKPGVRFAEPDYILNTNAIPNDPRYPDLWGLKKIGMETAWDINTGSTNVVVGVIDTGVDYTHADIGTNAMWSNPNETRNGADDDGNGFVDDIHGADCANDDGDPMDDNNHGTHVAGTIGPATNNAAGVAGINWKVKTMALKFLGSDGSGFLSDAVQCIDYAIAKRAHLTNNSWSGGGFSQALYDAISRAKAANQLFVAAAGNNNTNIDQSPSYPASYDLDNIVSVAATDSTDARSSFSNYGKTSVDLAAPGSGILSTVRGNGYAYFSGTSMASPHVAGTAALMLGKNGTSISYQKIRDAMLSSVDPVTGLQDLVVKGGRLNAAKSLQVNLSPGLPTNLAPAGTVVETGSLRSGAAGSLASDDASYYRVNSSTAGTRVSSWYASFTGVPSSLQSLKATYKGANSLGCSQTLSIWNHSSRSWVQLDSRTVGTTQVQISNVGPATSLNEYVNSVAGGEVRVRVRCTRSSGNFYSSGNLMRLTFQTS